MIQVDKSIFVGNQTDFYKIEIGEWAVIHACKDPFHKELAGYRGNLQSSHPNYGYIESGDRIALNVVDMNKYSENYLVHHQKIFEAAIDFIERKTKEKKKILIHCNQGESRGPSIAMLYLASIGKYNYKSYDLTVQEFIKTYPKFNPKISIKENVKNSWTKLVVKTEED